MKRKKTITMPIDTYYVSMTRHTITMYYDSKRRKKIYSRIV